MHDLSIAVFSYNGHQHLLPYCLRSVHLNAPAHREIILVWDDYVRRAPIDFDQLRLDTGVPFRIVLQSEIMPWPDTIGRWGWVKQQLAKLLCVNYCTSEFTWVIDGDVLVTGDPELFSDKSPILRYDPRRPVSESYKFFMNKYLGLTDINECTFVGSSGLMEHRLCRRLQSLCFDNCGMDLVKAVDHMLTSGSYPDLPFSEFEYYGHLARHENNHVTQPYNWNYVPYDRQWSLPLQIMWDTKCKKKDLQRRFDQLMQHQDLNG